MPGRVFLTDPPAAIAAALGVSSDPMADEPSRHNIAPGQQVIALTGDGLTRMRWGMIPVGRVNARGRPVMETIVNARSETLFQKSAFAGVGRAVMPVSGWYEWTGKTRRKTAWRIRPRQGGLLLFAAITDVWTAPGGQKVPQLATVTCAPSADVRDVHDRMAVILAPGDVMRWLRGAPDALTGVMVPWPEGRLQVEMAKDVDWSGP
ncbi:SOS response-associated peptidase [Sedimentitalea nanhaiensis]|uniref:Abasic site processing protein n=1 Tax=Sedimentitalea nanhaiensis TaxID=999627 RepID=A0A1I6XKK1_9RHOB|nr:SOS response-associated peptidase [Sedimentitalea nanhaiensis]SFT38364.1 Putative SOS response-associated peptidase YedK [Sedimentitalea nanhaiensis]